MDQMGNWNASHPKALKEIKDRRVCGLTADFSYDFFLHGYKCLHCFVSNRAYGDDFIRKGGIAGAQGGCLPGTYLVIEGSGTQSLWTLSQNGGFQVTSSAERAFGFSHIQGVWKKTGARDAKARGLDFNFKETPVNDGVPPSQITRLDIVMRFAESCEEMEGSFELRAFTSNDDPLDSNAPAIASDTFFGRRVRID
jgi:hypothetical protein